MTREVPPNPQGRFHHLGPVGRGVHLAVAAASLVLALGSLRTLHPDWGLVVLLHGFVTAAYFGLAAATGFSPILAALRSTGGPPGTRRLRRRVQARRERAA